MIAHLSKRKRTAICLFVSAILWFLFSAAIGVRNFISNAPPLSALFGLWWARLLVIAPVMVALLFFHPRKLPFRDEKAGSGQHGDAHFLTDAEAGETYTSVAFGYEKVPAFLVGLQGERWLLDTSDSNCMLIAPPGMGKTTSVVIPTVAYNARVNSNTGGKGASMMLMDIKGTLYSKCAPELQAHGYVTPVINLRDIFRSYQFNFIQNVNTEIDAWRAASTPEEKALHYGAAERYAKLDAASILNVAGGKVRDENKFFTDTARTMIVGFILLVSIYAPERARHIISVFELLIAFSQQDEDSAVTGIQKTKLVALMEHIKDKRIRNYVAPACSADIRTSLNIFSSALADLVRFIDAELEQVICGHSSELDARAFVDRPTAIFLICPDENTTRHFIASLFVRSFSDQLIHLAETEYNETLPRPFFYFLEEFGNMPSMEGVTSLFSAIRSRGGRVMVSLQSYSQLRLNYSEHQAETIEDCCQITINSALAPSSLKTAEKISKMLGSETILTGTRSVSHGNVTTTTSLIGRPLAAPDKLVTMPLGAFIVQKTGQAPTKSKLRYYKEYLKLETSLHTEPPILPYANVFSATPELIIAAADGCGYTLKKDMFDADDTDW